MWVLMYMRSATWLFQSLGDQAGHGLLGVGQAIPSGHGPVGGRSPVAAPDAELAEPAQNAGPVAVGADQLVSAESFR